MPDSTAVIPSDHAVSLSHDRLASLIECSLDQARDEMIESPYVIEALRVLPVRGYRSAIGCIWNAVVDDLRNKIIHRSLSLFNKAVQPRREVKRYEDFQNFVNDDELIDGAYEIGVIDWEAAKVLKHAKETRHIFDGHPRSSEPSPFKVLAMLDDCVRYVLSQPYPVEVVDIDEYLSTMQSPDFDRSEVAVANAIADLPAIYKEQLVHRLFDAYVHEDAPTDLRSNIELVAPVLWKHIEKSLRIKVVRRVDKEIAKGKSTRTHQAFKFVRTVGAAAYLSSTARSYRMEPVIRQLVDNLDKWSVEDEMITKLAPYAAVVPPELMRDYVGGVTRTFVGSIGSSFRYSRTDFYADAAAAKIPSMVKKFDDSAAVEFVTTIRKCEILRSRIRNAVKMDRLRILGKIVLDRVSRSFADRQLLECLVDPNREREFWKLISPKRRQS